MKKIYFVLLLIFVSFSAYSQEELLEGEWVLDSIFDQDILLQNPSNPISINFDTNSNSILVNTFCGNTNQISYIEPFTNNSFNFLEATWIPDNCSEDNQGFEAAIFFLFAGDSASGSTPVEMSYSITESDDDTLLELSYFFVDEEGGVGGVIGYFKKDISELQNLQNQWFLYSTTISGVQQNVPANTLFDIVLTDTNGSTGLQFFGDAICNGYSGEYNYLGNNSFEIINFSATLAECENQEDGNYEDNYFYNILYSESNTQLTFDIVGEGNNATLQINNPNGDFASYGRQSQSLNEYNYIDVSIFPNPTQDILRLEGFTSLQDIINLTIIDFNGRLVNKTKLVSKSIHVSHLKPGVYFLQLEDISNKKSKIIKFIKY